MSNKKVQRSVREIESMIDRPSRGNGFIVKQRRLDEGPDDYLQAVGRSLSRMVGVRVGTNRNQNVNAIVKDISAEVLIRRTNRDGDDVYFRQRVRFNRNEDVGSVGQQIINDVVNGDNNYADEQDYMDEGFQIVNAWPIDRGRNAPRSHRASHVFQPNHLERIMSMKQLLLRDFSCIYESLMIIAYHYFSQGQKFPIEYASWVQYVLGEYIKEPLEFQDAVQDGDVELCLELFEKSRGIKVGLYDVNLVREIDTAQYIKQEAYDYFLIYWCEHVFPVEVDKLFEVAAFIVNKLEKDERERAPLFIVPAVYNDLWDEFMLFFALEEEEREKEEMHLMTNIPPDFDFISFYILSRKKYRLGNETNQLEVQRQIAHYKTIRFTQEEALDQIEAIAYKKISNLQGDGAEERKQQMITKLRDKVIRNRQMRHLSFLPDDQMTVNASIAKQKQYAKCGLIALDIETAHDTTLTRSKYVIRPFSISIHGRLQKIAAVPRKEGGQLYLKRIVVNVSEVWFGINEYDCINLWLDWMSANGFFWSDYDVMQQEPVIAEKKNKGKAPRIFNYIVAHNGFGFDYKYIIEQLQKRTRGFQMIGDLQQTREIRGGGLFMIDFAKMIKGKLSDIAENFFPNDESVRKYDDVDVKGLQWSTIEEWNKEYLKGNVDPQLKKILDYNLQDSIVLFKCADKYFSFMFCNPHGHGFLPRIFYHSSPAMAWSMWESCFLKAPLFVLKNQEVRQLELESTLGGFNIVYRQRCGSGIVCDINSSYPTCCKNLMPLYYANPDDPITHFKEPILYTHDNYLGQIQTWNLYVYEVIYPEGTLYPNICKKHNGTIIQCLQFERVVTWGVQLILALEKYPGVVVYVKEMIEYIPGYVTDAYIDYNYERRLAFKEEKNELGSDIHKLFMNSQFGKFLTKQFKENMVGEWQTVIDQVNWLYQRNDIDPDQIEVAQIITDEVPMYELKYALKDQEYKCKGALRRFGSFITDCGRANIMRGALEIQRVLGDHALLYTDTDSLMISFDQLFTKEVNDEIEQGLEVFRKMDPATIEHARYEYQFGQKVLTAMEPYLEKLRQIIIQDTTQVHNSDAVCMMFDDKKLGAYKLERYIIKGTFPGQKQYRIFTIETNGLILCKQKIKGVRDANKLTTAFDQLDSEEFDSMKMIYVINEVWRRFATGVSIVDCLKIIRPTLYKRRYIDKECISYPYINEQQFDECKKIYDDIAKLDKREYVKQLKGLEIIQSIQQREENVITSALYREKNMLKKEAGEFVKTLEEQHELMKQYRKEFLIKLPKFKYCCVQNRILQCIVDNSFVQADMQMFLPKCIYSTYMTLVLRRKRNRHPLVIRGAASDIFNPMEEELKVSQESNSSRLSVKEYEVDSRQSARIISYTLYAYYIAQSFGLVITPQFRQMCQQLGEINMEMFGEKKDNDKNIRWRQCIAISLKFLTAPITVQEVGVNTDLKYKYSVTSLWRLFENYLTKGVIENNQNLQMDNELMLIDTTGVKNVDVDRLLFDQEQPMEFDAATYMYKPTVELSIGEQLMMQFIGSQLSKQKNDQGQLSSQELEKLLIVQNSYKGKIVEPQRLMMLEQNKMSGIQYNREHVFKQLILNQNFIRIDYEAKSVKMKQQVEYALKDIAKCQVESETSYCNIFNLQAYTKKKLVSVMDVVDIIFLFQFFYIGGMNAVNVYRSITTKYEELISKKVSIKAFIDITGFIFQKANVFGKLAEPSKSNGQYVKDFQQFIKWFQDSIIYNKKLTTDVAVRSLLEGFINKSSFMASKDLQQVVRFALTTKDVDPVEQMSPLQVGQALVQKVMQWQQPSQEMQDKLKYIMLAKSSSHEEAAQQVFIEEERMEQINSYIDTTMNQYIEKKKDQQVQVELPIQMQIVNKGEQPIVIKKESQDIEMNDFLRNRVDMMSQQLMEYANEQDDLSMQSWDDQEEEKHDRNVVQVRRAHERANQNITFYEDLERERQLRRLHDIELISIDSDEEYQFDRIQQQRQDRYLKPNMFFEAEAIEDDEEMLDEVIGKRTHSNDDDEDDIADLEQIISKRQKH